LADIDLANIHLANHIIHDLFYTVLTKCPSPKCFSTKSHGIQNVFREEKIKTMVDDIMEKLPDPFNMAEIMGKGPML
jgi:hypothetical protein